MKQMEDVHHVMTAVEASAAVPLVVVVVVAAAVAVEVGVGSKAVEVHPFLP